MNEKKDSIDNAIAKRCIENLMTLTRTWPRHLDTWALRIQFAEFLGWKEEVCELDGFQSLKSQYIYILYLCLFALFNFCLFPLDNVWKKCVIKFHNDMVVFISHIVGNIKDRKFD